MIKRNIKWLVSAASVAVLVVSMVACSSSDDDAAAAAPAAPAAAAKAAAPAAAAPAAAAPAAKAAAPAAPAAAAPAAKAVKGQTLEKKAVQKTTKERVAVEKTAASDAGPTGTLVTAIASVQSPSGWPTDCLWCSSITYAQIQDGLFKVVRTDAGLDIAPWLVRGWETADDMSYTQMELAEGVVFHNGFGTLDSTDVQWNYRALLPSHTPAARHDTGGGLDLSIGDIEVIDDQNFKMTWDSFHGTTMMQDLTDVNEGTGMFPSLDKVMAKTGITVKEEAEDWMRSNVIGTGPFVLDEWTVQKGMYMHANIDHWEKVPFVESVQVLEVPEASTRLAMLLTGQAHVAEVPLKDWGSLLEDSKYQKASEGTNDTWGFPFAGNYWEYTHAKTGEKLEYERKTDIPYVGNPFENGDTFDPNTASMQNSLKVRQALNGCIDREGLNEVIIDGMGKPAYLSTLQTSDPMWAENAEAWTVEFNCEASKALLAEAGQSDGFHVVMWQGFNGAQTEMMDAIGNNWLNQFNVTYEIDKRSYSTIRPGLVNHSQPFLRMHPCCWQPAVWPLEHIWSSHGAPGGYNHGYDMPSAAAAVPVKTNPNSTAEENYAASLAFRKEIAEWHINPGIVEAPYAAIFDASQIDQDTWANGDGSVGSGMRPFGQNRIGGVHDMHWIKLK
jgi:ABC-type transport system substrate-binding protein